MQKKQLQRKRVNCGGGGRKWGLNTWLNPAAVGQRNYRSSQVSGREGDLCLTERQPSSQKKKQYACTGCGGDVIKPKKTNKRRHGGGKTQGPISLGKRAAQARHQITRSWNTECGTQEGVHNSQKKMASSSSSLKKSGHVNESKIQGILLMARKKGTDPLRES